MSMTDAQVAAFQNASGYAPPQSSTLWIGLVLTLALLYAAWALYGAYKGWTVGSVNFGAFGAAAARVFLVVLVLIFFTLS